jgi:hypothetical protein
VNETTVQTTLLSVTTCVSVMATLLPPVSEVRRSQGDPSTEADVRTAEITGAVIALGIGATASLLTKSHVPFLGAVLATIAFVGMYEKVLITPPREATNVTARNLRSV